MGFLAARDKGVELFSSVAYTVYGAVHDYLRSVNAPVSHDVRIIALPPVELRLPEGILPTKVIPVRHFVGEY